MNDRCRRGGFSLMEVLLATAILLGSVLVLMELAGIGRYYVHSVENQSTAQMLCQTKLNELLSGSLPLDEVEERVVEDHPDWIYSIEIVPVGTLRLVAVRVTVTQQAPEGSATVIRGKPKSFTLVRWLRDDGEAGAIAPDSDQVSPPGMEEAPATAGSVDGSSTER